MSDPRPTTIRLLQSNALLLGALGLALLFAPVEAAAAMGWGVSSPAAPSLAAGGVLALAILDWTARGAIFGGIFGRPIVLANLVLAVTGGLALLKLQLASPEATPLGWVPVAILALQGVTFGRLLFGGARVHGEG
jgi:acyl dehydratase